MTVKIERITNKDISNHFQVSKSTVRVWVKQDKIVGYKLPSGHLRFTLEEVNKFANKYKMPEMV
jgi:predicted site-specific integrase-resolvase